MIRRRQRPRSRRRLPGWVGPVAALLSLALHAGVLTVVALLGAGAPVSGPPLPVVGLAPLTAADWDANRAIEGEARAPIARPPAPPPPAQPEPPLEGPVVEVPAPTPDEANRPKVHPKGEQVFLADRDSYAEKNTVSRHADVRNTNNLSKEQAGFAAKGARPAPGEGGSAPKASPGESGRSGRFGNGADRAKVPAQGHREAVALAPAPGGGELQVQAQPGADDLKGHDDVLAVPGAPGAPAGEKSAGMLDARLRPSERALERIAAGGPMMSLDGIQESEETLLNAREFKYATFFTRLYRAVAEQWNPERAYTLRDPDGSTYPAKSWRTQVRIKLDSQGQVKELRVVAASGLDFLDQEALRAVRTAAPFPNPPSAIVHDGEIDLQVWSFTYTTSVAHSNFGHFR